jgi:nitroimidazol reductase NimA-like FMN-containing flavoprotein (pyridoxamine 5'-phosphate oxidase superfamily)
LGAARARRYRSTRCRARLVPLIFPVNYALDGHRVTFRTAPGTKFAAAQHSRVSFQVDHIDSARHTSWSVLVLGPTSVVDPSDPSTLRRIKRLAINSLAAGDKPIWVQVDPEKVTGRRVSGSGLSLDDRGYLGLYY